MGEVGKLSKFRFWCQKVLPLVYDDSLSYYELLCKVIDYQNKMIEGENVLIEDVEQLKSEMSTVKSWISNFDYDKLGKYVYQWLDDNLAKMIFVEITNAGYFVYYIPESWEDIKLNTTGLDINIKGTDYGRLVLNY